MAVKPVTLPYAGRRRWDRGTPALNSTSRRHKYVYIQALLHPCNWNEKETQAFAVTWNDSPN